MLCTHTVPGRENESLPKVKMSVVAIHMQCTSVYLAINQSYSWLELIYRPITFPSDTASDKLQLN